MQPTRILPDVQCSLLCEEIRQEINGNFLLLGVLSVVRVPQLPVTAFKLFVFNRWTAGVGQFTETVRLIAPDGTTVVRQSQMKFALQDPANNATNVTVFPQVEFKAAGVYTIELLVDEVMKLRYPLPLVVVPQPRDPNAPAPSPATQAPRADAPKPEPPAQG